MGAKLPQTQLKIQAGFDPKTSLPLKMVNGTNYNDSTLSFDIRKQLRILDEQNAVNRYTWYNLPSGLTSQLVERILYYRGQGAFFYMSTNDTFFFLPYTLNGSIDVYGRYMGITPEMFQGTATTEKDGKEKPFIPGMVKKPIYDIAITPTMEMFEDGCVILKDYTPQQDETIISRQVIQEPLLMTMAQTIPMAQTALISNSGVKGIRVQDEDQAESVRIAGREITKAAMSGCPWVPITAQTEFQDLSNGTALKAEEYLLFLQGLDNYRLSLYGLDNGGLFQKKSHMLESEQEMNSIHAKLAFQDGLTLRQNFCNIVNSIWGLNIWCEGSTAAIGLQLTNGEEPKQEAPQQPNETEDSENGE